MKYDEKTVSENYIYRGKILSLRCDDAILPDGKDCKREIVEHTGGACVLAKTDGGVALVRQFRYAYHEEIYEIPAGKLNEGEDPIKAAARELSEETGLIAQRLKLLTVLYPTPGYTNEKIYIYEAEGLKKGEEHLDEGEFLDVEYFPEEEVLSMIRDGRIKDGKTIAAMFLSDLQKDASE